MSALVEPSRNASRPLTPHVATRHRRVGSCFRRPASASCATFERTGSVSPRDQNRSTVPSFRGAISSVARRWRNDSRRLPSCRILCLPPQIHTAFQPCTPDASRRRTEPFVVPSLLRSGMTPAHRFARRLALRPVTLRRESTCLAVRGSAAPRCPSGFRDERLPSVSAALAVCDGLTRPPAACLATVRGARARCVRPISASHCFRLRALAPHSFPVSLRGLRLAPSPEACTPDDGDWGTWRFKTPDPLRRVAPGCWAACSSAHSRHHRTSDTPVAVPWFPLRLRAARCPPSRPRP